MFDLLKSEKTRFPTRGWERLFSESESAENSARDGQPSRPRSNRSGLWLCVRDLHPVCL
jgi:hypothetical protein